MMLAVDYLRSFLLGENQQLTLRIGKIPTCLSRRIRALEQGVSNVTFRLKFGHLSRITKKVIDKF